jgi:coenzyme PQQ precursor peptide PqqA
VHRFFASFRLFFAIFAVKSFFDRSTQATNRDFFLHQERRLREKYARSFILDRNCNTAKNRRTPTGLRKHSGWLIFSSPAPLNLKTFVEGYRHCMAWTAPHFEEIHLNCEINSYVSAQL